MQLVPGVYRVKIKSIVSKALDDGREMFNISLTDLKSGTTMKLTRWLHTDKAVSFCKSDFSRLYQAAKVTGIKLNSFFNAADHNRYLKDKIIMVSVDWKDDQRRDVEVFRWGCDGEPMEFTGNTKLTHETTTMNTENAFGDAADLDAIFGATSTAPEPEPTSAPDPPAREPGADDDADFPL